jgi:uncharacterized protein (TIGR03435 family)
MRIEIQALYLLTMAVVPFPALAQSAQFQFEVVSIHPVARGSGMPIGIPNPTPNGFTTTAGVWQLLSFAYGPSSAAWNAAAWQSTEMRNEPGWVHDEIYGIDARVSQTDRKAWQEQDPRTHDLLRLALRATLKERFKLAIHEEPAKRTIFELVVARRGPRLKPADLKASLPAGVKLSSGGVMTGIGPRGENGWNFHAATMQDLADMMIQVSFDSPVRDRTGLTGRYDFQAMRISTPGENRGFAYDIAGLGLELKRGMENRPILVIDHVEKPTAN